MQPFHSQRWTQHLLRAIRAVGRLTGALLCLAAAAATGRADDVDPPPRAGASFASIQFSRDVLPLLARRCFACHGPDEAHRQANLRLDTRDGALREVDPVIRPRDAQASELLRRVMTNVRDQRMPPVDSGPALTAGEIELLRRWIDSGAPWADHWAFVPPRRPLPPLPASPAATLPSAPRATAPPRQAIDAFVAAQLEARCLVPAPRASHSTLLRRLSFDLLGLPPPGEAIAELLAESASSEAEDVELNPSEPDLLDRQIDKWLASPRFGERWGRHWLDVARYSDSTGFETDAPRTHWKYRDWVVEAINRDLPFEQFVVEQLAGDLLPGATDSQRVATGFLLGGPLDGGSEAARFDANVERLNTLGVTFLGLTLSCAQCHAHKFDPLTQSDYYGLFAFLHDSDESLLEFATAEQLARRNALRDQLAALEKEQRDYAQKVPAERIAQDAGNLERLQVIAEFKQRIPNYASALVLRQPATPRPTHRYERGEFANPREVVAPRAPAILPPLGGGAPNRLALARWLVAPDQPLTPRVTVNRVWQRLFGRGLVETEDDFGVQGTPPTHPELLDWLAVEFRQREGSLKALVRQIVSSATYQQSSARRPELDEVDPDNRWLARQARLRLDAEAVRDNALAVAGLMTNALGGPPVFPYQPEGILVNRATPAAWTPSGGGDQYRRTLYTHHWRLTPHPLFVTFDAPDSLAACTRRRASNTPLQALTLLHGPEFVACAEALAQLDASVSDKERIEQMFHRVLGRAPRRDEQEILERVAALPAPQSAPSVPGEWQRERWVQVARILLNLDETLTRE